MTQVELILQPAPERNRSMLIYASRLAANAPAGHRWTLRQLPRLPLDSKGRVSELLLAPPTLASINGPAHVIDPGHAHYLTWLRGPKVLTIHDLVPWKVGQGRYPADARPYLSRRARFIARRNYAAVKRADRIVADSRATAADVEDAFGRKADVVYLGVDRIFHDPPSSATTEELDRRLQAVAGRPVMLQVTSGFFYKNDAGVAAAFRQLSESHPDLAWVRVGAPPDAATTAWLLSSGCSNRFIHLDKVSIELLVAAYRRASVLVFPSWDEGFGWPPLEAMAAGCPVVASDRGSLAETAAPASLTVDPADAGSIAAGIARVLDEPALRQDLTDRGHRHVAAFTWQETADRMRGIYQSL